MRVPRFVVNWLWRRVAHHTHRIPNEIIGHNMRWRSRNPSGYPVVKPFLLRWFVIPKNRFCNVYIHQFIRDDEDRALHDHPWFNLSILLGGKYIEHTVAKGGVHWRRVFEAGAVKFRSPWSAHRVELTDRRHLLDPSELAPNLPEWVTYSDTKATSWSLFITGPTMHKWGFHCPQDGWRPSSQFHDKGGCQ